MKSKIASSGLRWLSLALMDLTLLLDLMIPTSTSTALQIGLGSASALLTTLPSLVSIGALTEPISGRFAMPTSSYSLPFQAVSRILMEHRTLLELIGLPSTVNSGGA